MMLSPLVRSIALYGSLALIAGALLVFYRRDAAAKVPTAIARGRASHALRRRLVRVAPLLGLALGVLGAVYIWSQENDVVVVTDAGARRMVLLGDRPPAAPDDRVWVINRSTHVVRVETVQYGRGYFGPDQPIVIRPGETRGFYQIDHVGPDDPPPDHVDDTVGMNVAFREWLTWDPR